MTHAPWLAEVAAARKEFDDQNLAYYKTGFSYSDAVHPAVVAHELADFLYKGQDPARANQHRVGWLRACALRAARAADIVRARS